MPALAHGLAMTALLVAISGAIGSVAGLILGLASTSPLFPARWVSNIYINVIRGIPPLIILFFMFFALPVLFPLATFSATITAIIGLSVYAAAYIAEIVRGSVNSVLPGQIEAAQALGMQYFVRMRYIVVPQAMKVAVPPGIGFLIALVKASALASVIGYIELTKEGHIVSTLNNQPLTVFLIVAGFYFVISYPFALLGRWSERRLA
jgi:polar amino acid transport system permease protein